MPTVPDRSEALVGLGNVAPRRVHDRHLVAPRAQGRDDLDRRGDGDVTLGGGAAGQDGYAHGPFVR